MNKEKMQKAINVVLNPVCHECYFPKKRTCQSCLDSNRKVVKKYIQDLESKLNKVTDKLKEDIRNDYCIKEIIGDAYITTGVEEYSVKPYAQEILNIIEGEKE